MDAFYKSGRVTLYHGSCIDVLPQLASETIGAVVTDPPYGQTNEGYDGSGAVSLGKSAWSECFRVCAESAPLVSFTGIPTYHKIATAIENGGWQVRQMWGWIYRDGLISSAWPKEGFDRLSPAMTPICYATKGKVLLQLAREGSAWEIRQKDRNGETFSGRSKSRESAKKADGHWPKSVVCTDDVDGLQYFVLSNNAIRHDGFKHPNQKPVCLMEWIIGKLPAQTILDPFCGSGSTGIACLKIGRNFVGIEQNLEYLDLAKRRLAAEEAANKLDGDCLAA